MAGADIAIDVIAAQMATQNMVNGSDPAQQIVNAAQAGAAIANLIGHPLGVVATNAAAAAGTMGLIELELQNGRTPSAALLMDLLGNLMMMGLGVGIMITPVGRTAQLITRGIGLGQIGLGVMGNIANAEDLDGIKKNTVSPIVLDLNGDGVTTSGLGRVFFDHDGDGFSEQTGWVDANDGFLVRDLNNNGFIENGSELFGSETLLTNGNKAANGFLALKELDSNNDGEISIDDVLFNELKIWKDTNGDGSSSSNELFSLTELSIKSINLGYTTSDYIDEFSNLHKQIGSYTMDDETIRSAVDVWFDVNKTFSLAVEEVEVSTDILALPDLVGQGTVYELHQAMARDSSGQLKLLVESFVSASTQLDRRVIFEKILLNWTGADEYEQTSRGLYALDGRHIYAIEALLGEKFVQGSGTNAATLNDSDPESVPNFV